MKEAPHLPLTKSCEPQEMIRSRQPLDQALATSLVFLALFARLPGSSAEAASNVNDSWIWIADRGKDNKDFDHSGAETTGSGSKLFGIAGNINNDDVDLDSPEVGPYTGEMGVYVQFVELSSLTGYYCNGTWPECDTYSKFSILEWKVINADDSWDPDTDGEFKILDMFELSPEGVGCSKSAGATSYFVPSGDSRYKDLRDRLEGEYKGDVDSEGGHSIPDAPGGPIGTGGFEGGVSDADGDGSEDVEEGGAESTEDIIGHGEPGRKAVAPDNGSHYVWISWNWCVGDEDDLGGGIQ